MASKTQYSHFVICKVWVLGFTHHFTLHPLIWQIFSLISWLYFSTMWILWGRKCDYWVFHITHAKKGLPNHSSSTRDLKDFFSICDVENTILTYPPHSILSMLRITPRAHNQKGTRPDLLKTQHCAPVELMKCLFWHALQLAHTKRKHFYRCLAIIPKSITFEIR